MVRQNNSVIHQTIQSQCEVDTTSPKFHTTSDQHEALNATQIRSCPLTQRGVTVGESITMNQPKN